MQLFYNDLPAKTSAISRCFFVKGWVLKPDGNRTDTAGNQISRNPRFAKNGSFFHHRLGIGPYGIWIYGVSGPGSDTPRNQICLEIRPCQIKSCGEWDPGNDFWISPRIQKHIWKLKGMKQGSGADLKGEEGLNVYCCSKGPFLGADRKEERRWWLS